MPEAGIQGNQPYLLVPCGGIRHNHTTKEYNSVNCSLYHLCSFFIHYESLLTGLHGPQQSVSSNCFLLL